MRISNRSGAALVTIEVPTSFPGRSLETLTEIKWPSGTVLDRELILAARDDRPWDHPDKPAS